MYNTDLCTVKHETVEKKNLKLYVFTFYNTILVKE